MRRVLRNPDAEVDWVRDGRFKASMHAHATVSDCIQTPTEVIDAHHANHDQTLALTDHDADPLQPGFRRGSTGLCGGSVDDSHQASHIGRNYHVYLLPDNTQAALRDAMAAGAYWLVHDPHGASAHRHENGEAAFWTAVPPIEPVDVTAPAIRIDAASYDAITCLTDEGGPVRDDHLGVYVRAILTGYVAPPPSPNRSTSIRPDRLRGAATYPRKLGPTAGQRGEDRSVEGSRRQEGSRSA